MQIGFNRRYDVGHHSLKQHLKQKIGRLEKIIITSRDPSPPSFKYLKTSGGIFKDMMIHDFDLARYYLGKDEFQSIFAMGSNLSDKRFNKINDYELATTILKSKKGVQCIITNSRHCSFGYDQRVELFGNKGMLVSDNKRNDEINYFSKSSTNSKSPLLHFFIERYSEAFKLQLFDLVKFSRKNIKIMKPFLIAEIGINHNGDIDIAKKLIDVASLSGCDAVKFQKRNPDVCVPEHQKNVIRDTPWGKMTYLEYKYKVEFGKQEYDEIDEYCKHRAMSWSASPWDLDSLDFLNQYDLSFIKVPSAMITNEPLMRSCAQTGKKIIFSSSF